MTTSFWAAVTVSLGLAAAQSAVAATSNAKVSGTGFSVSTGFSNSGTGSQLARVNDTVFFAPYGPNQLGAPPGAAYPIRYSGMAEANASTGILRARIDAEQLANVLPRGGDAEAIITGGFTLVGSNVGEAAPYSFLSRIDGLLKGDAGVSAEITIASASDPARRWTATVSSPSASYNATTTFDELLTLDIPGIVGESYTMTQKLRVYAATFLSSQSSADFSHTMSMTLVPSPGVTFVGADSFLNAAPLAAVPEPAPAVLLACGLAVLTWGTRRAQRREPATEP